MIRASDFRLFSVQAVAFTPDQSEFRGARVLSSILPKFAAKYDGDVQSNAPTHLELRGASPARVTIIPTVLLVSENNQWKYEARRDRVDSYWFTGDSDETPDIRDILQQCIEPLLVYPVAAEVQIGRLALIVRRRILRDAPAALLAQSFCQSALVEDENANAPLRHSREFQLHNLKRYESAINGITLNSWVRCFAQSAGDDPSIFVEQDINTLSEEVQTRAFHRDEIEEFFDKVLDEMNGILNLYFPVGEDQ